MYKTVKLDCAISADVCNKSVDFPIPGSPPINTREPGTIPPPSTRFNSFIDVVSRCSFSNSISFILVGLLILLPDVTALAACLGCFISSTNVFQLLQLVHLPIHFKDSYPHS